MKRIWAFVGLVLSLQAIAEPVSFNIRNAGVQEFCDLVIKGVLDRDYVLPVGLVPADKKVSVSIKSIEKEEALGVAQSVLASVDVVIEEKGGILYLKKKVDAPIVPNQPVQEMPTVSQVKEGKIEDSDVLNIVEVYWPMHRSIEVLSSAVKLAGAKIIEAKSNGGALVFSGREEVIEKTLKLLSKFDQPSMAVNVKAVLVEFSESSEKSNSFSSVLSAFSGKVGLTLEAGTKSVNAFTITGKSLQVLLSALEGDSRFRYVAEPSLRVLDGEKGKITVGSEVPTRGAVTLDQNGNSLQSIIYKTAGVMLELQPKIYKDSIIMAVNQQISSFAVTTTSGIDSPTVLKRDLQTTLDAKSGDVIVMAGMDESRESDTSSGFSWLPSLFSGHGSSKSRSQILLLLEVNRSI